MKPLTGSIYIPAECRGHVLTAYVLSVRLSGVLQNGAFKLLGDLHGKTYAELIKLRNCGVTTIRELREFVAAVQRQAEAPAPPEANEAPDRSGQLAVPESIRRLRFDQLPVSRRLLHVMQAMGASKLGGPGRPGVQ